MKSICFATVALLLSYSNIFAQDLYAIDKGQFVEQVYGSTLLEEGKDIIDYNNNHLMAGWIELEFEEETTSIDASLWFISNRGEELLHRSYGQIEFAEIGEGSATDDEFIYLAIRQTQESTMDENVSVSDSLIVLGLDEDGIILWTYKTGIEEGGIAPKDIIVDSDGNIAVLTNLIDANGLMASSVIKLSPGGNLLMKTNAYYGHSGDGTTSYELEEYDFGYYYTICNDVASNIPISLLFDMFNPTNLSDDPHTSLVDKFLFGFTITNQKKIYAAGFSITEGDTDAYIAGIDSNFVVTSSKRHGISGTELLYDIGESSDGFVAGGIANNQGEGGWDNYIIHLNSTATTVTLTETMGSEKDETSHHMRILKTDPKVYFPGMTLGFEERFGNASIMGTLSHPQGPTGANCDYPRIAYVDDLLLRSGGNIQGPSALLNNYQTIITKAHKYNIDYLILYGIDVLLDQWGDMGRPGYSTQEINNYTGTGNINVLYCMNKLVSLMIHANSDPNGIVFGMAVGGYDPFVNNTIAGINEIIKSTRVLNAHHSGKISMLVMEWEIWAQDDLNKEFILEDLATENAFRNSARVSALFPTIQNHGAAPNFYLEVKNSTLGASEKEELAAAYYHKLGKLRIKHLKKLKKERDRNANIKAVFDYLATLSSLDPLVKNYYSSYDETLNSSNAGTSIPEAQWKDDFAEDILKGSEADVDGVLLADYFDPGTNSIINYSLGSSGYQTDDFEALATVPGETFNYIPLLSAEMDGGCKRGVDGYMGNWLGGSNNLPYAESQFTDQFWSSYGALWGTARTQCPSCYDDTKVLGFAWYLLNCIDDNQKNYQTTFTNFGLSNCNGTGSYVISLEADAIETFVLNIFPNPTSERVIVELKPNSKKKEIGELFLFDLNGKLLMKEDIHSNKHFLDLSNLSSGTYIIRNSNTSVKITKI